MLSPPADNNQINLQPRAKARSVPFLVWSPGVRVESRGLKMAPWRPPASKCPCAKSFVSGGNVCKWLIFLKWHGRGREARISPDPPRLLNHVVSSVGSAAEPHPDHFLCSAYVPRSAWPGNWVPAGPGGVLGATPRGDHYRRLGPVPNQAT